MAMGDIAREHVANFLSGRWGVPIRPAVEYPKTTKTAIAGEVFKIVKVSNTALTNRLHGTVLIVCDQNESQYWVWANKKVTGIAKQACEVIKDNLTINEALAELGRKEWKPYVVDQGEPLQKSKSPGI